MKESIGTILGLLLTIIVFGGLYIIYLAMTYSFWSFLGMCVVGFFGFWILLLSNGPRF